MASSKLMNGVKLTCQYHRKENLSVPATIEEKFNCDCGPNGPVRCGVCNNSAKYSMDREYTTGRSNLCEKCFNAILEVRINEKEKVMKTKIEKVRKSMEEATGKMLRITIEEYNSSDQKKGWREVTKLGHNRTEKIEVFAIEGKDSHLNGVYNSISEFVQRITTLRVKDKTQREEMIDGILCTVVDGMDYIDEKSFVPGIIFGPACTIFGQWKYL